MTTPPTPTQATKNFDDAILGYSNAASIIFNDAKDAIVVTAPTAETAQSDLMGALAQLSGAARMQSEQRSREGFEAVVDLMKTTADAAGKISTKLVTLLQAAPGTVAQPTDYKLIDELKDALDALARLSPSAVWTAPGNATKSG